MTGGQTTTTDGAPLDGRGGRAPSTARAVVDPSEAVGDPARPGLAFPFGRVAYAFAVAAATSALLSAARPLATIETAYLRSGEVGAKFVSSLLGDGGSLAAARAAGALAVGLLAATLLAITFRLRGPLPWRGATALALGCALQANVVAAASDVRGIAATIAAAAVAAIVGYGAGFLRRVPPVAWTIGSAACACAVVAAIGPESTASRAATFFSEVFARRADSGLNGWATPVAGVFLVVCAAPPKVSRSTIARALASVVALAAFGVAGASENDGPRIFGIVASAAFALFLADGVSRVRNLPRAVVFAAGFAAFGAAHATEAARAEHEAARTAADWERLRGRIDEVLPPRESRGDVVLGVPESGPRRFQSALAALREEPFVFDLADAALDPPKRLRVARYGSPLASGYGANVPPELTLAFDALVDPSMRLESPIPGSTLPGMRPEDEPDFIFSLPLAADPGASSHLFTAVLFTPEPDGRVRIRGVPLDASLATRTESEGRARYLWRPSWRSDSHVNAELSIEHEELGAAGSTTWWTVLVGAAHTGVCAIAPPPPVQTRPVDPRRAAMFRRPTTCAVPASFALPSRP